MRESDAAAVEARARDDDEMFEVQQLKAMQQPSWNEGRLDDLNRKVDKGIERLDGEHKELRCEMRAGFRRLEESELLRAEREAGSERRDTKFDRQIWLLRGGTLAIVAAIIAAPHH